MVDNYGDIGVCWRLARQLSAELGMSVRLWVDDLASFARLCPSLAPSLDAQSIEGIEVRRWDAAALPAVIPAKRVIEAFACNLPEGFVFSHGRLPAGAGVDQSGIPQRRRLGGRLPWPAVAASQLAAAQAFFFPGFRDNTGGVLGEADVGAARGAAGRPGRHWAALGLTPPLAGELTVSLFCYGGERVDAWLDALLAHGEPVRVLVPDGRRRRRAAHWCGQWLAPGWQGQRGAVRVQGLPFVEQREYDRLLWLVRPESGARRGFFCARTMGGAAVCLAHLSTGRLRAPG